MNKEFFKALDLLEKQKNIPKEYMLSKVEAALLSAFKKDNGYTNVRIVLDPVKQDVKVYKQLLIVDPEGWDEIPVRRELTDEELEELGEYPKKPRKSFLKMLTLKLKMILMKMRKTKTSDLNMMKKAML